MQKLGRDNAGAQGQQNEKERFPGMVRAGARVVLCQAEKLGSYLEKLGSYLEETWETWETWEETWEETWDNQKNALIECFVLDKVPIECYTIIVGEEPPFNQKGANMKIRLKLKKGPPDGWLVIWSKEAGRKTALHVKLSFLRSHTPKEMRQIWQHRREELEKYHESKRRFPNEPQKWYGHPSIYP